MNFPDISLREPTPKDLDALTDKQNEIIFGIDKTIKHVTGYLFCYKMIAGGNDVYIFIENLNLDVTHCFILQDEAVSIDCYCRYLYSIHKSGAYDQMKNVGRQLNRIFEFSYFNNFQ